MYLVRLAPHMNAKGIASTSCRLSRLCRLCFIAPLPKRLGKPIPAVGSARVLALPTGWRRQLDMNIVRVRHAWACRIARRVVFAKRPMAMLRVVLPGDKHLDEMVGRKELELCEKTNGGETTRWPATAALRVEQAQCTSTVSSLLPRTASLRRIVAEWDDTVPGIVTKQYTRACQIRPWTQGKGYKFVERLNGKECGRGLALDIDFRKESWALSVKQGQAGKEKEALE